MYYGMGSLLLMTKMYGMKKLQNRWENQMEFQTCFTKYLETTLLRYKWNNLPDTCNSRFLELCLVFGAQAVIAKEGDTYVNYGCLPATGYNMYGDYTRVHCFALNGATKEIPVYVEGEDTNRIVTETAGGYNMGATPQGVVCWDSITRTPFIGTIIQYATRYADTMRTIDVCVKALKSPIIVEVDDDQYKSVIDLFKRRDENEALIVSRPGLNVQGMQVFDSRANSQNITVLWQHADQLDQKFYERIGIYNNDQIDKRERLLVDEVNANNEITNSIAQSRLLERQHFCEKVNEAFGLSISCEENETETPLPGDVASSRYSYRYMGVGRREEDNSALR